LIGANDQILVVGGHDETGADLATAEVFDGVTGNWVGTGSLSTPRESHTATALQNGKVLVAGGASNRVPLSSSEVYDPSAGTWSSNKNIQLDAARGGHTATLLNDGNVLAAGGQGVSGALFSAELYKAPSH
jgi:hypothetical protein